MQAHSARPRLPHRSRTMASQSGKFLPILAAVGRTKQRRIFHTSIDRIRVGERRLQVPHALELPRTLRSVIPLMRGEWVGGRVVGELVAGTLGRTGRDRLSGRHSRLVPGLAAVVRALNDLAEPSARLRGVNAIRIGGRSLEVIHFPSREMRAADVPLFTLAVRRKNECAFSRTDQNPYSTHSVLLLFSFFTLFPRFSGYSLFRIVTVDDSQHDTDHRYERASHQYDEGVP